MSITWRRDKWFSFRLEIWADGLVLKKENKKKKTIVGLDFSAFFKAKYLVQIFLTKL